MALLPAMKTSDFAAFVKALKLALFIYSCNMKAHEHE
jgi:hypothetical protein